MGRRRFDGGRRCDRRRLCWRSFRSLRQFLLLIGQIVRFRRIDQRDPGDAERLVSRPLGGPIAQQPCRNAYQQAVHDERCHPRPAAGRGTFRRRVEKCHRKLFGKKDLRLVRILRIEANAVNVRRRLRLSYNSFTRYTASFARNRRRFISNPWGFVLALEIVHYPHPALRRVAKPLKRVDADFRKMVEQMFDLMYEHEGVGLAGNQVDLPYRVFVMNPEGDPAVTDAEYVFINPVLSKGKGSASGTEGCLSIPGVNAEVIRKEKISIEAYDLSGQQIRADVDGLFARIVQHETDHLDGTLFIDRLTDTQRTDVRQALEEFEIDFASKQERGEMPSDDQIAARLEQLEALRA